MRMQKMRMRNDKMDDEIQPKSAIRHFGPNFPKKTASFFNKVELGNWVERLNGLIALRR